jgi:hypothetical protein
MVDTLNIARNGAKMDRFAANRVQAANKGPLTRILRTPRSTMFDFSFGELIAIATAMAVAVGVIYAIIIFATMLLRRK